MKKITTLVTVVLLTFIITENYILSRMEISGEPGAYTVTVFGADFRY